MKRVMYKKVVLMIIVSTLLATLLHALILPGEANQEAQLLLETDKDVYILGENVTITLTNIGNETVEIGGYPPWQILTYPEEEPVYPEVYAWLAWSLRPGENDTFTWNQYNEFTQSPAEPGMHVIKDTQGWGLSTYFRIIAADKIVPDDYPTIQEAINHADEGDTIYVCSGTYYEHVIINKTISLIGENPINTIIDGGKTASVVYVRASNSNISGFTIRNSGTSDRDSGVYVDHSSGNNISDNIITNNKCGIFIYQSSKNTLTNNTINANKVYGIHLWCSSNNTLTDNTASNNYDGIIIECSSNNILRNNTAFGNIWNFGVGGVELFHFVHDIDTSNKVEGKSIQYLINKKDIVIDSSWDVGYLCLVNSTNITVKDLALTTSNWHGVKFAYIRNSRIENVTISKTSYAIDFSYSSNNIIINNDILNRMGIRLHDSSDNTIINNSISSNYAAVLFYSSSNNIIVSNYIKNNRYGISLYDSSDNKIYHNNFIKNTDQARVSSDSLNNIWDDGYPSGGNYWSDYTGVDLFSGPYQNITGSDGIGDTPYGIDENNQDRYPLMKPKDQWVPYVPDHEEIDLAFWMVGEIAYVNVTITFSDPCFNITDWGTVTKSGYNIRVDTEIWRWTGACILVVPPPVCHTYELGPLESGTYKFTFQAWGVPVESVVFTIPLSPGIHITGIKPSEGPPGTKVCIFGGGATPEGAVVALFSGPLLEIPDVKPLLNITVGRTVADEEGYWNIQFTVPSLSTGKYVVYVVDNATQTSASTTFYVTPVIRIPFQINYVSPQSGPVGTSVYVSGSGATPNGEVMVYFDEINVVNITAKDWDWWSASFEVPEVEPGNYTIMALDVTTNATDTASFIVTPPPTIHVSPSEAPIGSKITIRGEGFTPKQCIFITSEDLLLFCPITTDENGEFNVTLFVPMVNSGNYIIKAITMYPYQSIANVSFTVTLGIDTLLSESSSEHDSLLSDYNDLKSKLEHLTGDLGTARNLSYIFIVTTIIFIATTAYLAIRKPKMKPELKTT